MQPVKILQTWLQENANAAHYLFSAQDLTILYPNLSVSAFKTLLSRTVDQGLFKRVCRGLYAYKPTDYANGLLLFHAAAYLRPHEFNYISLETALSDAGVISQIPINAITVMSSGRSSKISCNQFGTIEFVHTNQKPSDMRKHLSYDAVCRLWRASIPLALNDMRRTRRNTDLIDWDMANELI